MYEFQQRTADEMPEKLDGRGARLREGIGGCVGGGVAGGWVSVADAEVLVDVSPGCQRRFLMLSYTTLTSTRNANKVRNGDPEQLLHGGRFFIRRQCPDRAVFWIALYRILNLFVATHTLKASSGVLVCTSPRTVEIKI